ncbi:MAG: bifunctional phosphoribosylaminoimidazolecarboxamide formyltransferase/IMP cyclohydrolase [Microscillaceae bacterium]|nr:bifunctional phosphoribosylaminoimidazolecarboxamide formyltransferase/IMP cyclohydrolase [Microscillaceae bacterium]
MKKIQSALISVYHKEGLEPIISLLQKNQVKIYSTGGTQQYIESLGGEVIAVESLTGYPSILGGRVKTLHPKVFGGILYRADVQDDQAEMSQFEIPELDLVIVDLYPFEQTLAAGGTEAEIIEKIDIGGISLIRAAAKNFKEVAIVASQAQYSYIENKLREHQGSLSLEDRKWLATQAFHVSSHYDTAIFQYFSQDSIDILPFKQSIPQGKTLRYGENPHQKGIYYGDLEAMLDQLSGKELSYNNLVDVDGAVALVEEFEDTAYAIIKHTNACGMAIAETPKEAYLKALAGDPVSAFGGVIATNRPVDLESAEELHKLFFEVLIAPEFEEDALSLLRQKQNRILLKKKQKINSLYQFKTILNGVIFQDRDTKVVEAYELRTVTRKSPSDEEVKALLFANVLVKHAKSNTIVLAKNNQLLAAGVGQTSRVDALKQAIAKANEFGFDLQGAVMASDAFFPFPDCVEIAGQVGIKAVIQPGGSIRDQDSIDACDQLGMAMVLTGFRHFKH